MHAHKPDKISEYGQIHYKIAYDEEENKLYVQVLSYKPSCSYMKRISATVHLLPGDGDPEYCDIKDKLSIRFKKHAVFKNVQTDGKFLTVSIRVTKFDWKGNMEYIGEVQVPLQNFPIENTTDLHKISSAEGEKPILKNQPKSPIPSLRGRPDQQNHAKTDSKQGRREDAHLFSNGVTANLGSCTEETLSNIQVYHGSKETLVAKPSNAFGQRILGKIHYKIQHDDKANSISVQVLETEPSNSIGVAILVHLLPGKRAPISCVKQQGECWSKEHCVVFENLSDVYKDRTVVIRVKHSNSRKKEFNAEVQVPYQAFPIDDWSDVHEISSAECEKPILKTKPENDSTQEDRIDAQMIQSVDTSTDGDTSETEVLSQKNSFLPKNENLGKNDKMSDSDQKEYQRNRGKETGTEVLNLEHSDSHVYYIHDERKATKRDSNADDESNQTLGDKSVRPKRRPTPPQRPQTLDSNSEAVHEPVKNKSTDEDGQRKEIKQMKMVPEAELRDYVLQTEMQEMKIKLETKMQDMRKKQETKETEKETEMKDMQGKLAQLEKKLDQSSNQEHKTEPKTLKKQTNSFNSTSKEKNKDKIFACNIKSPPSQVKSIHSQIVQMIKKIFVANGCELKNGGEKPTLVTVVNASRTKSDIERDMNAAKLTSSESTDVILLRIVQVKDPNEKVEKTHSDKYILDLTFLADTQTPIKLHDCSHNEEQCEELYDFLNQ